MQFFAASNYDLGCMQQLSDKDVFATRVGRESNDGLYCEFVFLPEYGKFISNSLIFINILNQ